MAGAADLVAAFTGGDRLEQDAYSQAAQRIASAQAAQALMDKRIQEAYDLRKKSSMSDAFGNILSEIAPEIQGQNYQLTPAQISGLYKYGTGGGVSDIENVIKGLQEQFMRQRVLEGRTTEGMTDPNAVINSYLKPELVPTVEKEGDLMIRGRYSAEPVIDALMTNENAIAGAKSDKSGALKGKEQEIAYYVSVLGMPLPEAVKKAYGRSRMTMDELGNVVSIDDTAPLSNAVTSVPISGPTTGQPIPTPKPGDTLSEMAPDVTGPANYIVGTAGRAMDLIPGVGLPEWAKPTVEGQAKFKSNMRTLVRSLAETRAFREQEYILNELSTMPGFFKGEETLETQIDSLRDVLIRMLAQEERDAQDPSIGRENQELAQSNALRIRNFLPVLGGSQQSGPQLPPDQMQEAQARAREAYPGWDDLSPADQMLIIQDDLANQGVY